MIITVKPTKKQHEAYLKLKDHTTRYILFGGASSGGKSWVGSEWLLTSCYFFPGTRYFVGRSELKKLRESFLLTFFKVCRFHKIEPDTLFKFNGSDNYIQFNNGSRITLLDLRFEPSDPLFERFGSLEFTSGFMEEAGETDVRAFDVLKSRIGRCENDTYNLFPKILLTANPKKNFLYFDFYKPWQAGTLSPEKAFIPALLSDNPHLDSGYKDQLLSMNNRAYIERLLHGNWEYSDCATKLMNFEAIQAIFHKENVKTGEHYVTADIARMGRDKTVIMLWDGLKVIKIIELKKTLTDVVARKVQDLADQYHIPPNRIVADEDGVGGGVVDALRCKGFINNSSPIESMGKKTNFSNLKTQCYYRLSEYINAGNISVVTYDDHVKKCLIEELESVQLKEIDPEGKIRLISKDDVKQMIGRSPDYSDCMMFRMYFELRPQREFFAV